MKMALASLAIFGLFTVGGTAIDMAQADQCVQQCRAAHNQCRIDTKGSPTCDGQLQACMDGCGKGR